MANFDPVYLTLNDQPRTILGVMDQLHARHAAHAARYRRRSWLPLLLGLAALPLFALDWLLGYGTCLASIGGLGCLAGALVMHTALRRSRPGTAFPPDFGVARTLINTLRDDIAPRRTFLGHLDLTGTDQPAKLFRTGSNALGKPVSYYRDEWLRLKLKLYDGNQLRLSAIKRSKVRAGYYKRSSSGKQKWKQAKEQRYQVLELRLAVNPAVYDLAPSAGPAVGQQIGIYQIETLSTHGGIIELRATSWQTTAPSQDILAVLRAAYSLLKRKGT